jgi:hypothetical protein
VTKSSAFSLNHRLNIISKKDKIAIKTMSILIVVANPDDELFSVGATASALANQGLSGHSCILFNLI